MNANANSNASLTQPTQDDQEALHTRLLSDSAASSQTIDSQASRPGQPFISSSSSLNQSDQSNRSEDQSAQSHVHRVNSPLSSSAWQAESDFQLPGAEAAAAAAAAAAALPTSGQEELHLRAQSDGASRWPNDQHQQLHLQQPPASLSLSSSFEPDAFDSSWASPLSFSSASSPRAAEPLLVRNRIKQQSNDSIQARYNNPLNRHQTAGHDVEREVDLDVRASLWPPSASSRSSTSRSLRLDSSLHAVALPRLVSRRRRREEEQENPDEAEADAAPPARSPFDAALDAIPDVTTRQSLTIRAMLLALFILLTFVTSLQISYYIARAAIQQTDTSSATDAWHTTIRISEQAGADYLNCARTQTRQCKQQLASVQLQLQQSIIQRQNTNSNITSVLTQQSGNCQTAAAAILTQLTNAIDAGAPLEYKTPLQGCNSTSRIALQSLLSNSSRQTVALATLARSAAFGSTPVRQLNATLQSALVSLKRYQDYNSAFVQNKTNSIRRVVQPLRDITIYPFLGQVASISGQSLDSISSSISALVVSFQSRWNQFFDCLVSPTRTPARVLDPNWQETNLICPLQASLLAQSAYAYNEAVGSLQRTVTLAQRLIADMSSYSSQLFASLASLQSALSDVGLAVSFANLPLSQSDLTALLPNVQSFGQWTQLDDFAQLVDVQALIDACNAMPGRLSNAVFDLSSTLTRAFVSQIVLLRQSADQTKTQLSAVMQQSFNAMNAAVAAFFVRVNTLIVPLRQLFADYNPPILTLPSQQLITQLDSLTREFTQAQASISQQLRSALTGTQVNLSLLATQAKADYAGINASSVTAQLSSLYASLDLSSVSVQLSKSESYSSRYDTSAFALAGSTLVLLAVVCDYMMRFYSSLKLAKHWIIQPQAQLPAVELPAPTKQERPIRRSSDRESTHRSPRHSSTSAMKLSAAGVSRSLLQALVYSPVALGSAVAILFILAFIVATLYWPLLVSYRHTCVDSFDSSTLVSHNLAALQYLAATTPGQAELVSGLALYNMRRARFCTLLKVQTLQAQMTSESQCRAAALTLYSAQQKLKLIQQCVDTSHWNQTNTNTTTSNDASTSNSFGSDFLTPSFAASIDDWSNSRCKVDLTSDLASSTTVSVNASLDASSTQASKSAALLLRLSSASYAPSFGLQNAILNCSLQPDCDDGLCGVGVRIAPIRTATHVAWCRSQYTAHLYAFTFALTALIGLSFAMSRSMLERSLTSFFSRALLPHGVQLVALVSVDGRIDDFSTYELRIRRALKKRYAALERIATMQLIGAILIHVPYCVLLVGISQNWFGPMTPRQPPEATPQN